MQIEYLTWLFAERRVIYFRGRLLGLMSNHMKPWLILFLKFLCSSPVHGMQGRIFFYYHSFIMSKLLAKWKTSTWLGLVRWLIPLFCATFLLFLFFTVSLAHVILSNVLSSLFTFSPFHICVPFFYWCSSIAEAHQKFPS